MSSRPLLPEDGRVAVITGETEHERDDLSTVATRDRALITRWARQRGAEPATGEATESGPGVIDVQDGGAGIRFNFPGVSRYRPISWDEWFGNFERHDLLFVYERDAPGATPSGRYRLVTGEALAALAAPAGSVVR